MYREHYKVGVASHNPTHVQKASSPPKRNQVQILAEVGQDHNENFVPDDKGESVIISAASGKVTVSSATPPNSHHRVALSISSSAVDLRHESSPQSLDPCIGIPVDEDISVSRDSSFSGLYNYKSALGTGSVDFYYNEHRQPRRTTKTTGSSGRRRRSSSIISSLPYFHPDPYSIALPRYFDELGSLSTYSSSVSGSETTEYLHLSTTSSSQHSLCSSPELGALPSLSFHNPKEKGSIETKREKVSGESGDEEESSNINENKMNFDSALSTSEEYQSFRCSVALKRICVEADGTKEWKVYDAGPRSIRTPLLCIGPACSTADVFFKQMLNLTARGVRVLSVESPVYWSVDDWCKGLKKLLDCMNIDKVHIFGASLGGFLAQKFAEYTYHYSRVASLILCNAFLDTSIFEYNDSAMVFWMLPSVILKKLIVENITSSRIMDLEIAHAIEFMIERLNNLPQQELASRMTLNCVNCHVDTFKLKPIKMTIMDVFDESALSSDARDDLYRSYTDAKLAHLKSGGNFPYLSRSEDVNMHIMVHLRAFNGTKHSAELQETLNEVFTNGGSGDAAPTTSPISNGMGREDNDDSTTSPQDIHEATEPPSALEDKDQAFKEKAASELLPVS